MLQLCLVFADHRHTCASHEYALHKTSSEASAATRDQHVLIRKRDWFACGFDLASKVPHDRRNYEHQEEDAGRQLHVIVETQHGQNVPHPAEHRAYGVKQVADQFWNPAEQVDASGLTLGSSRLDGVIQSLCGLIIDVEIDRLLFRLPMLVGQSVYELTQLGEKADFLHGILLWFYLQLWLPLVRTILGLCTC